MTPEEFQKKLKGLETEFKDLFQAAAPRIIGVVAVREFKKNFQDGGFFGERWKEVKRRSNPPEYKSKTITRGKQKGEVRKTAWMRRKILTGATGDLGRSIKVKSASNGQVIIWTDPVKFTHSKEPYGRVHNEGLRAGRGAGFTMPQRQFIGDHPKLREAIITELDRKLHEIINK
ncbi:hypothetical protein AGMMS49525_11590 [Bacteroidia bacterium]|nr:hypothetical protein AGMMS49525_11590 [Bacteroidia bacterium]